MAETVLLGYLAASKDTVMVTSMKADFFEKKVGVPGVALDIPVCTEAESQAIFDDNYWLTSARKPLETKGFRALCANGRITLNLMVLI